MDNTQLLGLTAKDRADWEKKYQDKLQGLPTEQVDRIYKDSRFRLKFKDMENYDELSQMSPDQRDSLYNDNVQMSSFMDNQKSISEQSIGQLQEFVHNTKASNQVQEDKKLNEEEAKVDELLKDVNPYDPNNYKAFKLTQDFDTFANDNSPYYKAFKDTESLPLSDEDKYNIMQSYDADKKIFGEEKALQRFKDTIQRTVSEQTPLSKKYGRGIMDAGKNLVVGGLYTAGMAFGLREASLTGDGNAILDNELTRYADEVSKWGSLTPKGIERAKELGISRTQSLRTPEEERGSIGDNIFSENTIPEIVGQSGHILGAMVGGRIYSALANAVFKGAKGATMAAKSAGVLKNLEQTKNILYTLQKAQQGVNAFVIPGAVGTTHAAMNAMQAKDTYLEESKQQLGKVQEERVESEVQKLVQDLGQEGLQRLGYNLQDPESVQKLYKDVFDGQVDTYVDDVEKIDSDANKVMWTAFGIGSTINGLIGSSLKAGIHAPAVQESLRRSKIFNTLFNSPKFSVNGNTVTANTKNVLGKIVTPLKEPTGEFIEEASENITVDATSAAGINNLSKYLQNKYGSDGRDDSAEIMSSDIVAALAAAGESAVSKETILSGIYGALSSGMGNVSLDSERLRQASKGNRSAWEFINPRNYWRNPILESIQRDRAEEAERVSTANTLTTWLQDPANKASYDGTVGTLNWSKDIESASQVGDEFNYRNSVLGKTINDVLMLDKLQGTPFHDSFLQEVQKAANLEEGSKEADDFITQFKNADENKGMDYTDEQALTAIKKNANTLLNTIDAIKKESKELERVLGNSVTEDAKQAMIYGKLASENLKGRGESLNNELSEIEFTSSITNNPKTEEQKSILAKYGSFESITNNINSVTRKKESVEKDIANIKNRKNLKLKDKNILKEKQNTLKLLTKELQVLENNKNSYIANNDSSNLLSEVDIMNLSAEDRAFMLDPENSNKYSEEQQSIINNVLAQGTLKYADFTSKIKDANKINKLRVDYLNQYMEALNNPNNLNREANRIKNKAFKEATVKKYEHINNIEKYSEFSKAIESALSSSSSEEAAIISSIVKDNPHFKKFISNRKRLFGLYSQLNTNSNFKDLEQNDRNLVVAAMQFLNQKDIDPSNVTLGAAALASEDGREFQEYLDNLNSSNSEKIKFSNIENIIKTYTDINAAYDKNEELVSTIETPIEEEDTTEKDSTPPKAKPEETPEVVENPPSGGPNIFATNDVFNNPDGNGNKTAETTTPTEKEVPREEPEIVEEPSIIENYEDNSNSEVALAASIINSSIENANIPILEGYKKQAKEVLEELGASEYSTVDAFKNALSKRAEDISLTSRAVGDEADAISTLLRMGLRDLDNSTPTPEILEEEEIGIEDIINDEIKEEKSKESIVDKFNNTKGTTQSGNDVTNEPFMTTASFDNYPDSPLGLAEKRFKIKEFLQFGNFNNKTPIMFIADPALIAAVKEDMGDKYDDNTTMPIMAVVRTPNGPIQIDGKNYQPIGFLPSSSAKTRGSKRTSKFRKLALSQQDGSLLKNEKGEVIISTSRQGVNATAPRHRYASEGRKAIREVLINSMSDTDLEILNDPNTTVEEKRNIFAKYKEEFKSNLKRETHDKKGERTHLNYMARNLKGSRTPFEIFISTPENSKSLKKQIPLKEVFTGGNSLERINFNNRTRKFTKVLYKAFLTNPFKNEAFHPNSLIPTETYKKELESFTLDLAKKLDRYINITSDFKYNLVPTNNFNGENRIYSLELKGINGKTLYLGDVHNGTITNDVLANILTTLFMDNTVLYNKGANPNVKWQVDYNNTVLLDEGNNIPASEKNAQINKIMQEDISSIIDDNILEVNKDTFKYTISGVDIRDPFSDNNTLAPKVESTGKDSVPPSPIDAPTLVSSNQVIQENAIIDGDSGVVLEGKVNSEKPKTEEVVKNNSVRRKVKNRFKDSSPVVETPVANINAAWKDLTAEERKRLLQQKITQESWDNPEIMTSELKRKFLECI